MALIVGSGIFVLGVLTAVLSSLAAAEIKAWSPWVIRRLIKFAAGRLPEDKRERFEEEWQSHVNDVPGQVGKLVVAIGFLKAAYGVALTARTDELKGWRSLLAQLDDMQSAATTMLNMTQNEPLACLEGLSELANTRKSLISKTQVVRDELEIAVAAVSAIPQPLISILFFPPLDYKLREKREQLSQLLTRLSEADATGLKIMQALIAESIRKELRDTHAQSE